MKKINRFRYILFLAIFLMAGVSCETDFPNPNNPTEETLLNSKDGLFALSIGMHQYYVTTVMRQVIEAPGITTRELGVTNTFLNINELARGGTELPPESGGITNPWVAMLRSKGMAESIINNVDNVDVSSGTRSSLLAYAHFHKAALLGYMINMFEQAPIDNDPDGAAVFSDRTTVLAECIRLLDDARTLLASDPVTAEFQSEVIGANINLEDCINAYLSRFNLMAGNYQDAIDDADLVSPTNTSYYTYDANNVNPIWNRTVNSADLNPQTNFGLVGSYIPEGGDERVGFYLGADAGFANNDAGGQPLSELLGFFATQTSSIPVYLWGEMMLNKAEAYARLTDLPNAVAMIDAVRAKTAATDPYGVGANLAAWGGDPNSQSEILEEIYKNRGIELFLTGLRLEDSRRFHPSFDPLSGDNTMNERNRNFYPYPFIERENNPNTPPDPAI